MNVWVSSYPKGSPIIQSSGAFSNLSPWPPDTAPCSCPPPYRKTVLVHFSGHWWLFSLPNPQMFSKVLGLNFLFCICSPFVSLTIVARTFRFYFSWALILEFQIPAGHLHLNLLAEPQINKTVQTHPLPSFMPAFPITSLHLSMTLPSHHLSWKFSLSIPIWTLLSSLSWIPLMTYLPACPSRSHPHPSTGFNDLRLPRCTGSNPTAYRAQLKCHLPSKAFFDPPHSPVARMVSSFSKSLKHSLPAVSQHNYVHLTRRVHNKPSILTLQVFSEYLGNI